MQIHPPPKVFNRQNNKDVRCQKWKKNLFKYPPPRVPSNELPLL